MDIICNPQCFILLDNHITRMRLSTVEDEGEGYTWYDYTEVGWATTSQEVGERLELEWDKMWGKHTGGLNVH